MKKLIILLVGLVIAIGFFYPKTKAVDGMRVSFDLADTTPTPKCFGILRVRDVYDATLYTCYGIFTKS